MENLKENNESENVKYLLNLLGFEENEIIDSIKELKYELNEEVNRDEKRTDKLINDDIIFEKSKLQALRDLKNINVTAKKYYEYNNNSKTCYKKINIIAEINNMKIITEYSHNDCSNIYTKNIVLYQNDELLKKDKDYHIKDSKYKCNFKLNKKITSSIFFLNRIIRPFMDIDQFEYFFNNLKID
jgi:hypothetical protein